MLIMYIFKSSKTIDIQNKYTLYLFYIASFRGEELDNYLCDTKKFWSIHLIITLANTCANKSFVGKLLNIFLINIIS